jgi:hypothetical protein
MPEELRSVPAPSDHATGQLRSPDALSRSSRTALTPRVAILGLILIPINALWITWTEFVSYSDNVTTQALFFNAVALLLILQLVNGILNRWAPQYALSRAERLGLYLLVAAASGIAGHDTLQILFTTITYPVRHALSDTAFGDEVLPSLPNHLVVHDTEAISSLYSGASTLYRWDHIQPWLIPLGCWSLFTLTLIGTMLCLTTLFRRPWENERLSYPIAELPIQILTEEKTLFRTPLLWAGFSIGAMFQLANLLHVLFPSVPGIQTGVTYYHSPIFPWSAAGDIPLCSYAFAYGLTFLLPTQLGFSCWFFFLVSRLELVLAAVAGYTDWGKFPYVQQQGVGAIFGFFLTILYAARSHLVQVWMSVTGGPPMDDSDEPMSYRTAVFGLFAGFAAMICFAVSAGMHWKTAALFFSILLIIVVVVARLRAEIGLPTFELYQVGGDQILPAIGGTNAWSKGDYTGMTLFFFLTRTHRQFPMQSQVDAMRIGKRSGTSLRSLTGLLLLASAFGILCAFWAFLHTIYRVGYESAIFQGPAVWAFGVDPWKKWGSWIHSPRPPDSGVFGAYIFGIAFTLFLSFMRARFFWWPFHPAGYLVSGSFGLFRLWLPLFVSWLVKVLILRYGGLRAYRSALPFAYGLILGEFSMGFLRSLLDITFDLGIPASSGIGGL